MVEFHQFFVGLISPNQYKCLKYHIDYLNILTMETIPEHELQKAEQLIIQHHKLFVQEYFSSNTTKFKTFISI